MFGCGKGGNYTLDYMRDYTKTYIKTAKSWKLKNLTIVESDVHKLLGMDAVFELRKYFENSGMNVLYVWHKEEGIEGLYRMAEKYDYIALSVPELRIICKGKVRYQDAVKDLLQKIKSNVKKMPRIHLLGNTVMETMETNIAYSCDSTSYLAGAQFGRVMDFDDCKIKSISIRSKEHLINRSRLKRELINEMDEVLEISKGKKETMLNYISNVYLSARAYSLYQGYLDKNFKCIAEK